MLEGDVARYVNQKLQHLPEQPLGGCRAAVEWTSFGPKSCDPITIKLEEAQLLRAPGEARHMEVRHNKVTDSLMCLHRGDGAIALEFMALSMLDYCLSSVRCQGDGGSHRLPPPAPCRTPPGRRLLCTKFHVPTIQQEFPPSIVF